MKLPYRYIGSWPIFCVVWVVICLSGLGVCAVLFERSYCVGCYVLCLVVDILFSVGCRSRDLLYMYLTVAYLCCIGWLEVKGVMVSVNVGFLNMAVLKPVGVLHIDRTR